MNKIISRLNQISRKQFLLSLFFLIIGLLIGSFIFGFSDFIEGWNAASDEILGR